MEVNQRSDFVHVGWTVAQADGVRIRQDGLKSRQRGLVSAREQLRVGVGGGDLFGELRSERTLVGPQIAGIAQPRTRMSCFPQPHGIRTRPQPASSFSRCDDREAVERSPHAVAGACSATCLSEHRRSGVRVIAPDRALGPRDAGLLLAAERAVDLGARIMRQGRSHIGALIAKGDRDFATEIDLHIESAIKASLAEATPEIPFLGEEEGGETNPERARWVLDPIDGTINFARDIPLCAISLSLLVAGEPVLGIVDAPFLGERFIARQGEGAFLNGNPITIFELPGLHEAIIGIADFKVGVGSEEENRVHLAVLARLAHQTLRVRMLGSAALDLAWLACGRLNATLMLSNLAWDVTAGLLLVREAGGFVYDYDGSPHTADSRYTIASVPSLVEPVRQIIAESM